MTALIGGLRLLLLLLRRQDPYWSQIGVLMAQFDGMIKGYQAAAPRSKVRMHIP